MKPMTQKLSKLQAAMDIAQQVIDRHLPAVEGLLTTQPVTLTRREFDCLVLCALSGLDEADHVETESEWS